MLTDRRRRRARILAPTHPLWLCGFRPFFLATALAAVLPMLLWALFLGPGGPLPQSVGGATVWHAHEMLFGFALAAVAGFALTAIPEFTGSAPIAARPVRGLAVLWLAGRLAFGLQGPLGTTALLASGIIHLAFCLGLIAVLAPPLCADPLRRHRAFLWALAALAGTVAGFYAEALAGGLPARWLHAALGILMVLILLAMSRISMRIVNGALAEAGRTGTTYLARPPRRNLAISGILLHTLAELAAPGSRIGGWLALAAAAALCHLQADWHIGRVLFRRWPLMLFGVHVLMAAGYALLGAAPLTGADLAGAGRHLLTVGALGLAVFVVLNIAGRMHCGLRLDEHRWLPAAALGLVVAALARAAASALPGAPAGLLFGIAAAGWMLAFAAYAWRMIPVFMRPRTDGADGCAGVAGG